MKGTRKVNAYRNLWIVYRYSLHTARCIDMTLYWCSEIASGAASVIALHNVCNPVRYEHKLEALILAMYML